MAGEGDDHSHTRLTTMTLPLRPRSDDTSTMTPPVYTAVPPSLVSPGIQVEFHGDFSGKPAPIYPR
jgi:[calcium/calmodulin-dependent protein kinase] kinase